MFTDLKQDLIFATRQLRRSPGFTATALLTLTLAIGATAAMVSVLRATLLNPTPYADARCLVSIKDINLKGFSANGLVTIARTADLAEASLLSSGKAKLLSSSAFFYFDQPSLVIDGHLPISVTSIGASGDFFKVLGTKPLLGRWFTSGDDTRAAAGVAVISYSLWQHAFSGDEHIIGRAVMLAGKPTLIIGVMPRAFDYPGATELWRPAQLSYKDFNAYRGASTRFVNVIARLAPGVSTQEAQRSLDVLAERLAHSYAETDGNWGFKVAELRAEILGGYREGLLILSSAIGMLLLIACANIAGLQLSRNAKRQPEMALRRALGISNARLLRQLMTESLLLMLTGSALGVGLCVVLLRIFAAALPPALLSFASPRLDVVTLLVTIAIGVAAGVLCGIIPAVQFGKTSERELMPLNQNRVARGTKRFDRSSAILQLALALVLLTLATSVIENLHSLLNLRLGYDISHVLTVSVHLPFGTEMEKAERFHQQLEKSLATLPGVESVGAIDALPLTSVMFQSSADIEGQAPTPHQDTVVVEGRSITPTYLTTMRIPLLAGRSMTERDAEPGAPQVVLVNQRFVAKYFPHGDALGKHLVSGARRAEIVGIIADVRGTGGRLDGTIQPEIDEPERGRWPNLQFVLRTSLPAATLEPVMKQRLAAIDGGLALGPVTPLSGSLEQMLLLPRLNTGLLTALAGLALVLAVIGVYGVIAFSVSQRTREIGVRIALGSTRSAVLQMLLRESAVVLTMGLAFGVGGALVATKVLAASIPNQAASTAGTLAASSVVLVVAVLSASYVPARRASLIEPVEALRAE